MPSILARKPSFASRSMTREVAVFLFALVFLKFLPTADAAVIVDKFNSDGSFATSSNIVATSKSINLSGTVRLTRAAVKFTVTNFDYRLSSVMLPISYSGPAPSNYLKVSLTADTANVPGAVIEVLSLNSNTWPGAPLSIAKTLTSSSNPLLLQGNSYWIVTELSSTPPSNVDYRWYLNSESNNSPFLQQQTSGATLPTSWPGASSPTRVAFRVEGAVVPEPGTLSLYGVSLLGAFVAKQTRRKKLGRMVSV
jgi:hypothetical protein